MTGEPRASTPSATLSPAVRPTTQPAGNTTPAHPYDLQSNLAYAAPMPPGSTGHLLDLYVPTDGPGPFPVVLWQGGSAWYSNQTKDGADPPRLALDLAPFGYAVAAVNTRNTVDQLDGDDDAHWPDQLYDIKAAIRYLRSKAAMYHLDEEHFGIIGDSSGGWTAAMAGVTGGVQSLEGTIGVTGESSRVQAVVDLYGPTDFLEMDSHACRPNGGCTSSITHDAAHSPESDLVGCPIQTCKAKVERANPVNYVTEDDPPFLIMHGEDDDMVPHHESVLLFEALRAACVDVRFISLPNHQHEHHYLDDPNESNPRFVQTVLGCNPPSRGHAPAATYGTIRHFFDASLKPTPSPPAWTPVQEREVSVVSGRSWQDSHDAPVGWVDVRRVSTNGSNDGYWIFELAAKPPPAADLEPGLLIAYGLVLDTTGDGVADYLVGIDNDAPKPGDFHVWVTDLATRSTSRSGPRTASLSSSATLTIISRANTWAEPWSSPSFPARRPRIWTQTRCASMRGRPRAETARSSPGTTPRTLVG